MIRSSVIGLLSFSASTLTLACGTDDKPRDPEPMSHSAAHWSYSGAEGPEYWGALSNEFALCGEGRFQSPVDFPRQLTPAELSHLEFSYAATGASIADNGHTIVVQLDDDANELMVNGEAHTLLQFHFHALSEHRVDGKAYPLELHFVHASKDGGLAVFGLFFEEGPENDVLAEVFDKMAESTQEPLALEHDLNLPSLLPARGHGWNYSGSLTTPPCTEGVNWNVHATPITASAAQLAAFTSLHDGSFRPVGDNEHLDELLGEVLRD